MKKILSLTRVISTRLMPKRLLTSVFRCNVFLFRSLSGRDLRAGMEQNLPDPINPAHF